MYVIFSVIAILNARFFFHVGIYNFARAISISIRAFTSSNVHLDFQLTFHAKLESAGMTQSMSRVGKCIDNGPMEGFWGILKRERYYGKRFQDRESLVSMIENYIDYYNNKRLQRNLGVLTPREKHDTYMMAA